jgi:hypothetical protein
LSQEAGVTMEDVVGQLFGQIFVPAALGALPAGCGG